jgi:FG-GAP-like repeat
LSIADWNGDGNPDLADLNPAIPNRNPLFYPGRGDGTLQVARTQLGVGSNNINTSLLTLDVNGDGFPDLVTGGLGGIIVSLGNATGHYDQPTVVGGVPGVTDDDTDRGYDFAFGRAITVATADLNGDGRMDLVSGSGVSLQMPDGQFAAPHRYGPPAIESVIGDLNGDGKPDIVEITADGMIQTLLNDGKGGFTVGSSFNPGEGPSSLLLRDLNGDGKLDVAFTLQGHYDPNTNTYVNAGVGIALGNGDGSFGAVRRYDVARVLPAAFIMPRLRPSQIQVRSCQATSMAMASSIWSSANTRWTRSASRT